MFDYWFSSFIYTHSSKEQNNSLQAKGVQRGEEEAVAYRYPKEEDVVTDGGQLCLQCRAGAEAVACHCFSKPLCVCAWLPEGVEGGRAAVGCAAVECAAGMTEAVQ